MSVATASAPGTLEPSGGGAGCDQRLLEADPQVAGLELVRRAEPGGLTDEVDVALGEEALVVGASVLDHLTDAAHDGGEVDLYLPRPDPELGSPSCIVRDLCSPDQGLGRDTPARDSGAAHGAGLEEHDLRAAAPRLESSAHACHAAAEDRDVVRVSRRSRFRAYPRRPGGRLGGSLGSARWPSGSHTADVPPSPLEAWSRRANSSPRAQVSGCSSAAGTRPTRRSRLLRCSASPSRCRPGSAATASRSSGATDGQKASTRPGRPRRPRCRLEPVEELGPRSVTVPGAVQGWATLAERYGRLGLDACLADAIDTAEQGYAAAWHVADMWSSGPAPPELGPPPATGQRVTLPELGATLRAIATDGPDAFYRGRVAEAISSVCWVTEDDLAGFAPRWVEPLRLRYRGVEVLELPPPGQGVAALEALGLLEGLEPTLVNQIACSRLALDDAFAHVRDGADVSGLLDPAFLARRRVEASRPARELPGGTVYLCAVDGDRMAVSFIQSLYDGFGSQVVAPGTGVVLQNRGACFAVSGRVEPGRRPYHTIIPGMLLRDGGLLGPFGNMGGFIQAQAHLQLVSGLVDDGLDPQAALDRPRFRVDGDVVRLEEGLWPRAAELEAAGFAVELDSDVYGFGGGQMVLVEGDALSGGSDPRKDGYAGGL